MTEDALLRVFGMYGAIEDVHIVNQGGGVSWREIMSRPSLRLRVLHLHRRRGACARSPDAATEMEGQYRICKKGEEGVHLYGREGLYKVHPVEYKKGEPKENNADRLQLVAQAICLEEMMCTRIEESDLYYGTTKRREHVEITDSLRQEVENICLQMHQYFDRQYTPNIKRTKSCNACSLKNICLPQLSKKKSVHNYILKTIKDGEL